jgi:hypothetical protein
MRTLVRVLILVILIIVASGYNLKKTDYRIARNMNVCKSLKGSSLLYFVFVDNRETRPWTQYDIQSTIDSIRVAISWLHRQAEINHIVLNIIADYYIGKEYTTITKNLPSGTIFQSITEPNLTKGIAAINKWANAVAKEAGNTLPISEKDGIPEISNPKNKERLVAYLRDANNVESVALFFMMNNYFKTDISVQMNTTNTNDVEFAVVSYKYPSEIAHNFLHLYGAADMYPTVYRKNENKIRTLQNLFPDEVMLDPYGKDIWDLEISDYTRYLIGWTDEMNSEYEPLMVDRAMNF